MAIDPNIAAAKVARQDLRMGGDANPTPFSPVPTAASTANLHTMVGQANSGPLGTPTKVAAVHKQGKGKK